jgi:hypothetical protein
MKRDVFFVGAFVVLVIFSVFFLCVYTLVAEIIGE